MAFSTLLAALCVLPHLAYALLLPADALGVGIMRTRTPQRACVVLEDDVPNVGPMLKDANARMKKSVSNVAEQLSTLRVGRATSDMLDRVQAHTSPSIDSRCCVAPSTSVHAG